MGAGDFSVAGFTERTDGKYGGWSECEPKSLRKLLYAIWGNGSMLDPYEYHPEHKDRLVAWFAEKWNGHEGFKLPHIPFTWSLWSKVLNPQTVIFITRRNPDKVYASLYCNRHRCVSWHEVDEFMQTYALFQDEMVRDWPHCEYIDFRDMTQPDRQGAVVNAIAKYFPGRRIDLATIWESTGETEPGDTGN